MISKYFSGAKSKIEEDTDKPNKIRGLNIQDIKAFIIATIVLFDSAMTNPSELKAVIIWISQHPSKGCLLFFSAPVRRSQTLVLTIRL